MTVASTTIEKRVETTLPGIVEKIIKPLDPSLPEMAQISVGNTEGLEIRIDNVLKDKDGQKVALQPGARVRVTIEANPEDTTTKGLAPSVAF